MKKEKRTIIISDNDNDWRTVAKFANFLLESRLTVLWAQDSFNAKVGKSNNLFAAGSIMVPFGQVFNYSTNPIKNYEMIEKEVENWRIRAHTISGELDVDAAYLRPARVALYADGGSPYPFADILSNVGIEYNDLTAVDIRNGELEDYDVLIIPGGGELGPPVQGELLGEIGRQRVREFVHKGGGLWGSCAGCCNIIYMPEETINSWKPLFKDWRGMYSLEVINAEYWSVGMSGVGKLTVKNIRKDHPIMLGMPEEFEMTWHLGPFLNPIERRNRDASDPIPLLQLKDFTKEWTSAEFTHSPTKQKETGALEKTYAGKAISEQRFGIIAGYYGLGKVCACGGHPEFGLDWLLEKWDLPAKMIVNFVFWVVSSSVPCSYLKRGTKHLPFKSASMSAPKYLHKKLVKRCDAIRKEVAKLALKPLKPTPQWLTDERAESTFGLTALQKWPSIIARLTKLPDEIEVEDAALQERHVELKIRLEKCEKLAESILIENPNTFSLAQTLDEMRLRILNQILGINEDYNYKRPVEWRQDYGWQGALALLDSALQGIQKATKGYDEIEVSDKSPYNIIWNWYLGSMYDLINALIIIRGRERLTELIIKVSDFVLKLYQNDIKALKHPTY
ncbi:MAG: hypothetical protein QXJ17_01440 [Nitrososphaeria archaeon]